LSTRLRIETRQNEQCQIRRRLGKFDTQQVAFQVTVHDVREIEYIHESPDNSWAPNMYSLAQSSHQ
jgi:hypothetical protein